MSSYIPFAAQRCCILCGAIGGRLYPSGDPSLAGHVKRSVCALDSRRLCDRPACVRSRSNPDRSKSSSTRRPRGRFPRDIKRWVYAQGHSETDPNLRCKERMGNKPFPVRGFGPSVNSELFHIFCMAIDDDDSFTEFRAKIEESVSKTLLWLQSQAIERSPSPSLSTGTTRQDVAAKIESQRGICECLREYRHDVPLSASELSKIARLPAYEKQIEKLMLAEYEKERAEGERLRDEAFAQWSRENPTQDHEIARYHLMRFADVLIPTKPRSFREIGGVKTEGFVSGSAYVEEFNQESQNRAEDRASDRRAAFSRIMNDDEDSDDGWSDSYGIGHEYTLDGLRETEEPTDPAVLKRKFQRAYNPSGTATKEEVRQRIEATPDDAIAYVTLLDNIPLKNVRDYKAEKKVNTVATQLRRRLQQITREAIRATGAAEHFAAGELEKHFPKNIERKEGFYVRVKFPRRPWMFYPLPVAGSLRDYDEEAMDKALFDLQFRIAMERLRKRPAPANGDAYRHEYEIGRAVKQVFDRCEIHYLTFSSSEKAA